MTTDDIIALIRKYIFKDNYSLDVNIREDIEYLQYMYNTEFIMIMVDKYGEYYAVTTKSERDRFYNTVRHKERYSYISISELIKQERVEKISELLNGNNN
jgi:hypothetical protein